MEICDPKGRDCIEENFSKTFDCNTTCEGIYANIEWARENIEEGFKDEKRDRMAGSDFQGGLLDDSFLFLQEEINLMKKEMIFMKNDFEARLKKSAGERGQELDREKYKMLISEYRKFKTKNVKHFRFNSAANSSFYGKFYIALCPKMKIIIR